MVKLSSHAEALIYAAIGQCVKFVEDHPNSTDEQRNDSRILIRGLMFREVAVATDSIEQARAAEIAFDEALEMILKDASRRDALCG